MKIRKKIEGLQMNFASRFSILIFILFASPIFLSAQDQSVEVLDDGTSLKSPEELRQTYIDFKNIKKYEKSLDELSKEKAKDLLAIRKQNILDEQAMEKSRQDEIRRLKMNPDMDAVAREQYEDDKLYAEQLKQERLEQIFILERNQYRAKIKNHPYKISGNEEYDLDPKYKHRVNRPHGGLKRVQNKKDDASPSFFNKDSEKW